MDKSTIIYIIAIGLFLLAKAFGKKKQQEVSKSEGGSLLETLFGEEANPQPTQSSHPMDDVFESFGQKEPIVEPPSPPKPEYRFSTIEARSEESEFPQDKADIIDTPGNAIFQPLDVAPDENDFFANQEAFSHAGAFDTAEQDEATINANNEIGKETHTMVDSNNLMAFHQDFSLRKAMLFYEVMKPKFQEF